MSWKTTYHTVSTDGKTEVIHSELRLHFPTSKWNRDPETCVIEVRFWDHKVPREYLRNGELEFILPPSKQCNIRYNHIQRHPQTELHTQTCGVSYEVFTLEYCQVYAVRIFKQRLLEVLYQL